MGRCSDDPRSLPGSHSETLPKYSATFISLGFTVHNLTPLFRTAPQVTAPDGNRWDVLQGDPRTRVRRWGRKVGCGLAAPVGAHQRGWQAWVRAHGDGGRGGCGCPLLVLAAWHPGKLPETRVISDERQTERGK